MLISSPSSPLRSLACFLVGLSSKQHLGMLRAAFLETLQTLIPDRRPTVRCFGKMAGGVAGIFLARVYTPGPADTGVRRFQDLR
jgi:hypothetical protein